MLKVENVTVSFGRRQVFEQLSFGISEGEKVGLVGNNGAGKTTILRMLAGEIRPDSGIIVLPKLPVCYIPQHISTPKSGTGQNVLTFMLESRGLWTIANRMAEIEAAFDRNDPSLTDETIDEYTALQERFAENEGYRAQSDIGYLLAGVGLGSVPIDQTVHTLSGGQRTKLLLARMLYRHSGLLLLDEPTNHIDPESINWLGSYLKQSKQSMLVVSHLPSFLDRFTQRIISLEGVPIRARSYRGNYSRFLAQKSARDLSLTREQAGLAGQIKREEDFIAGAAQHQSGLKHARERKVVKLKQRQVETPREREMKIAFPVTDPLNRQVLSAKDISKSYGSKPVFKGVSLTLEPEERLAVIGDNGAGKSTLLRVLAGELPLDRGEVKRHPKLQIGWYRQEQEDLNDLNTVLQEALTTRIEKKRVRSVLAHFLFTAELLDQIVGTLSRGERARLCLAKIVLNGPNVLLLDEPTNHLDRPSRESLIQALTQFKGAMIVVTHDDENFLERIGVVWALAMPSGKLVRVD
jgi:ATP-binding cassette subfamily F protein 3